MRNLISFPEHLFISTNDGRWSAEASSLGIGPGDSFRTIVLLLANKQIRIFKFYAASKDAEGDILTWMYRNTDSSDTEYNHLTIFND